jgi:Holliday junction resolvase RusA-like endonuclease
MTKKEKLMEKASIYKFLIKVDPVAKKRVRVYSSKGGRVHGVNPSRQDEDHLYKLILDIKNKPNKKDISQNNMSIPPKPLDIPLLLGVKFYKSPPKSTRKKDLELIPFELYRPSTRPDLDNYLKLVKDAATGLLWTDDNLIIGYLPGTGKYFSIDGPRIEFTIITSGIDMHLLYIDELNKEIERVTTFNLNLDDFF